MNNFLSYFEIAFQNLKKNKTRAFFTIIAIVLAIAILIIMMAAGNGLKEMIMSEIDYYGSDVINVEMRIPGKGTMGSASEMSTGAIVTTFKNKDVEEIEKHPNVESLYTYLTGQEVIKYENESKNVIIFGYGANAPNIEKMNIAEGRFYTEDEEDSLAFVIVLGSAIKEKLFGDDDAVSKTVYVKGLPFKVVGVMEERGATFSIDLDSMVYIPTKTMQKRILGTDYILGVSLKVKDESKIDQTKEDLIYLMREQHEITDPNRDDFEVATMIEAMGMVQSVLSSINFLLIALAIISLIVGGVGITNIMYVSVVERTFEIGLRMAVGAKKRDVLFQFLSEAFLLTLIGGIIGILVGIGIIFLFNYFSLKLSIGITASVSISSIIWALIFSTFLGLFFGVYPAKKASNLDPISALAKK